MKRAFGLSGSLVAFDDYFPTFINQLNHTRLK